MEIRVLRLRDWMRRAKCRGSRYDFVPDAESAIGLSGLKAGFCDLCPVRDECLVTALRNGWKGYWGGTLTSERDKLRSLKHRKKCPICKSVNLITADQTQICAACSRSWTIPIAHATDQQETMTMKEHI